MSMEPQDIHNFDLKYKRIKKRLEESDISPRNKRFIKDFDNCCLLEGLSKPRRIKLLSTVLIIAKKLGKDFDKTIKKDLKEFVIEVESREDYSPYTRQDYKGTLKKFYKWLVYGDEYKNKQEYPEIVSWINTSMKSKDMPRVQASDILSEDEMRRLIDCAEHPRDKAFISILYELGARIGEIGNLEIRDLTRNKYGFIVDLKGKTGHRTPIIVVSTPYLINWLNQHSDPSNPTAPLWILKGGRDKGRKMMYSSLRAMVRRLVKRAGIKKRVYPHLFRHTRVTHLLCTKQINEAQAKVYFGWTPDSDQLSQYSHLMSGDANNALLDMYGVRDPKEKEGKLKPKKCPACNNINPGDFLFCGRCSSVLDVKTAIKLDEQRQESDEAIHEFVRELIENNSSAVIDALRRKPELMNKIKNLAT